MSADDGLTRPQQLSRTRAKEPLVIVFNGRLVGLTLGICGSPLCHAVAKDSIGHSCTGKEREQVVRRKSTERWLWWTDGRPG